MNSAVSFIAPLVLALAGSAGSQNDDDVGVRADAEQLIVEGRIVLLQGACNAVQCPAIQYEIAVTKIRQKPIGSERDAPDATFAVLEACGQSGLILGGHYLFSLRRNKNGFQSIFDRPSGEGGGYLECTYVFDALDVQPVPLSQRFRQCDTSLAHGSEQQRCIFEAVAKRCNKVDACLIKCWSQETGKGIGGGCHHICWSEEPERWVLPPEAAICKKME